MLRLFRVERCADGAPWAPWMCDVLAGAGAFVNAAPGLLGWLWCVLRLRGIRGRVCGRRAWFAGMIVVCVYVCVEYVDAFVDTAPGLLGWLWCVFTYVWYA